MALISPVQQSMPQTGYSSAAMIASQMLLLLLWLMSMVIVVDAHDSFAHYAVSMQAVFDDVWQQRCTL